MIADRIENADSYVGMGERVATALTFLGKTDFAEVPDGKLDIRGDEIFALVQRYKTKPREQGKWEAHRNYIDIQYMAEGRELIGVNDVSGMRVTEPYSSESDVMFLDDSGGDFVALSKGRFVVLLPHDAHMPCIADGEQGAVLKVVVKIRAI